MVALHKPPNSIFCASRCLRLPLSVVVDALFTTIQDSVFPFQAILSSSKASTPPSLLLFFALISPQHCSPSPNSLQAHLCSQCCTPPDDRDTYIRSESYKADPSASSTTIRFPPHFTSASQMHTSVLDNRKSSITRRVLRKSQSSKRHVGDARNRQGACGSLCGCSVAPLGQMSADEMVPGDRCSLCWPYLGETYITRNAIALNESQLFRDLQYQLQGRSDLFRSCHTFLAMN